MCIRKLLFIVLLIATIYCNSLRISRIANNNYIKLFESHNNDFTTMRKDPIDQYLHKTDHQKNLSNNTILINKIDINNVIVNQKQKKRRESDNFVYGLKNISNYALLNEDLDDFLDFMTEYSLNSQDSPVRMATAEVYMRHAKLFIGWYLMHHNLYDKLDISIKEIFKTKEKESADSVLKFLKW